MSQIEIARAAYVALQNVLPQLESARWHLRKVLGDSQNPPPDGASDGTIGEPLWARLQRVQKAIQQLTLACADMQYAAEPRCDRCAKL